MRRAKVRYSPDAQEDLDRAFFAVVELSQSVRIADGYVRRLADRCSRIGDLPLGGQPRDDLFHGLRIAHLEKSAVIAYRIVDGEVEVTNIFSAGEDYESVLSGVRERHED